MIGKIFLSVAQTLGGIPEKNTEMTIWVAFLVFAISAMIYLISLMLRSKPEKYEKVKSTNPEKDEVLKIANKALFLKIVAKKSEMKGGGEKDE